ncbi:MAG: hypothetical protein AMXMBFR82_09380 [Candidatus Hydrogenedentota bacterium]
MTSVSTLATTWSTISAWIAGALNAAIANTAIVENPNLLIILIGDRILSAASITQRAAVGPQRHAPPPSTKHGKRRQNTLYNSVEYNTAPESLANDARHL